MSNSNSNELKVAVIVGHHYYDVCPFQDMFTDIPGVHCYFQHLEQFTSSVHEVRRSYDVLVFYTMWLDTPINDGPWYEGDAFDALNELGETNQGIFMLHHSILAFQKWKKWSEVCGVGPEDYKDYHLDVPMTFRVADPEHPIMKGLPAEFSFVDEAYEMGPAGSDTHVLLTTDYKENIPTVAWTRQYKKSRVFCYQSGHSNTSYSDANFKEIVKRGIYWLGGKL